MECGTQWGTSTDSGFARSLSFRVAQFGVCCAQSESGSLLSLRYLLGAVRRSCLRRYGARTAVQSQEGLARQPIPVKSTAAAHPAECSRSNRVARKWYSTPTARTVSNRPCCQHVHESTTCRISSPYIYDPQLRQSSSANEPSTPRLTTSHRSQAPSRLHTPQAICAVVASRCLLAVSASTETNRDLLQSQDYLQKVQ